VASELPPLRRDEDDAESEADEDEDARRRFRLLLNFEGEGESVIAKAETGESRVFGESEDGYRVFTRAYDTELEAAGLVRRALLLEFRERLDQRVAAQGINLRAWRASCARCWLCRSATAGCSTRRRVASTAGGCRAWSPRRPRGGCFARTASSPRQTIAW
jgi:hypothetical protein